MTRTEQANEIVAMTAEIQKMNKSHQELVAGLVTELMDVCTVLMNDGMEHLPLLLERMMKEKSGYKFSKVLNTFVEFKVIQHGELTALHVNETDLVDQLGTHSSKSTVIFLSETMNDVLTGVLHAMVAKEIVELKDIDPEIEEFDIKYNIDAIPEIDLVRIRSINENGITTDVCLNLEIMEALFGEDKTTEEE